MGNEIFTFVICSHLGHSVEQQYCNRRDADDHFERLVAEMDVVTGLFVAYYCASAGGLVNAQYTDR